MGLIFPPILEAQRESIASQTAPSSFTIPITLSQTVNPDDIRAGHIQVLIRRQLDMAPMALSGINAAPEGEVLYLNGSGSYLNSTNTAIVVPSGLLSLFIAGDYVSDPSPTGRIYTIQVRFGDNPTWGSNINDFAQWKADQIANSAFGEWSNTQRMFVYGGNPNTIFQVATVDDILATLEWTYSPISVDPVMQARVQYSWSTPDAYGATYKAKNIPITSSGSSSSGAFGRVELNLMLYSRITILLQLTTSNNSVFTKVITIQNDSYTDQGYKFEDLTPADTIQRSIQEYPIVGEELEDGVVALTFSGSFTRNSKKLSNAPYGLYYKIYRVDLITLETVQVGTVYQKKTIDLDLVTAEDYILYQKYLKDIDTFRYEHDSDYRREVDNTLAQWMTKYEDGELFSTTIRDYAVEMGAEYQYMAASYCQNTHKINDLIIPFSQHLRPDKWNPVLAEGYTRQLDFQGNVFLTTQYQQLRLQGNVTVGSFKRATSDQITTTIGGVYPFYSRAAAFNYRTFTLGGTVTMNFDTTHTFLKFKTQDNEEVVSAKSAIAQQYQLALAALKVSGNYTSADVAALQTIYYDQLKMIYSGINPITYTKLNTDWMDGQLWFSKDSDTEYIQLRATEIFSREEYSLSRKRVGSKKDERNHFLDSLDNLDGISYLGTSGATDSSDRIRGATTRFNDQKMKDVTKVYESDRASERIYAERKYRDTVMEWLSNGEPKLMRSETEGNMIVMLTSINFSPLNKRREVYSFSATATEIAECNLENMIMYGLVPVQFSSFYIPNIEFGYTEGSVDTNITTAY